MVFEWAVTGDGGGLTGNNLRRHRAEHLLLGKGACRRLAKLLPGHAVDNGTAAEVPFALAEWLSSVVLRLDPGAEAKLIYANQLGPNRMGKALDRALGKIKSDEPRHASVLRAELRRFGAIDFDKGGSGTEAYILHANELYEVATAFPTGVNIDDVYDWIGMWTLGRLVAADGTLVVYGDLVYPLGDRFISDIALAVNGPFDRLAKAITMSLDEDEKTDFIGLNAAEAAEELAAVVLRALPGPDELADCGGTRTASLLALRRMLRSSHSGQVLVVTPANVNTVIEHHEATRLVVGSNVGGVVALNTVIELLRLALRTSVSSVALGQLATGMAALNDLLPSLRTARLRSMSPSERLGFNVRRAINQFMRGVEGEALWRLVPRSMAFGIEHFQPWLAQLAAAGHVVARVKEGFEVVDTSRAPPTKLNRPYLAELFAETGCADLLLRDAVLTHGFVYFADLAPQVVLQKPLRSFFTGLEQLLSLHSETLRMSESGWFELICMPELDAGVIELPCCPCRLDPSGLVGRQLEARVRGIKNCGAPHELLLCMAPPSPPLHEHSGGGRVPVISTNAATGMRSGKGVVREARAQAAGGKLPPAAQRHTPGLRRAAEAFGERDTLEIGRAPAPSSASGAARRETKSWAGGRWLWPQELKPFFIDLMLAACILGHGAELCGADLYVAGDDIKDMFHAFPLAALQCWSMGLLRLDPHALTAESLDAALCVVQARCLEMGVAPSSNWAQRFLTEINLGFSKRFARANEPLLLALDEAHPPFAAWRAARRELSARTGRDEALGHWVSGYTDDIVALVIGVDSMVLFLCMHAEHFGPRGVNMRMAVAAKRSLGVSAKFIGGKLLTTGSLVYVEPEKVLRTDGALQDAIAGKLTLADWTKLVGLLNHLVCILLMPYYIMYDVYDISDACRDARLGPDDTIVTTPKGVKALRRWLAQLRSTAGTTALSAAFALRRAGVGGTVHALRSDAAILGTGKPAICGALYGAVYVLALTPQWLEMPIVVLEYLGGLLNLIIFGPRLRGAPCALLLDALVVPTVMAGKASAPMMRFLQLRFVALVRDLELNLQVGHEYGPFNPICDAGSRGKMREMEAIINNLNLTLEHVDVPAAGLELMAETHAEWSRLAETERAAARAADAEVAALRRQHGVRAVMAHPDAGGCAPEALGLGRSPACNAYDGPGSEAEHFAPAGLESGLAAAADAPRVRVGRTANGPTAAAPVGVAVEVVALPLTRSAASVVPRVVPDV